MCSVLRPFVFFLMLTIETVREQFFIFSQILASRQLEHPRRVLEDMISTATQLTGLPGHVQSALVMNTFKLYCSLCHAWTEETTIQQEGIVSVSDESSTVYKLLDRLLELTNFLMDKFTLFVHSPDLEVQDRVSLMAEEGHTVNASSICPSLNGILHIFFFLECLRNEP